MTTKYIPMPSNSIGGFLYKSGQTLKLMTILSPQEVTVPLEVRDKSQVRSAVDDYFCYNCEHRISNSEWQRVCETQSISAVSKYCKENNKCPGSKRFATKGCLAGYTNESDLFQVSQAKFTTPIIGLETRYTLSVTNSSTFRLNRLGYFWYAFLDESLRTYTVYNNFNVFGNASTCWGNRGIPKTPLEAYNEFFASLTSSDLTNQSGRSLKYAIENWSPNLETSNTADNYPAAYILSKTLVSKDHPLTGVLISSNANWLTNVIEQDLATDSAGNSFFVGWVRETSTGATVVCGKHLVYLIDNIGSTKKTPIVLGRRKEFNF